MKLPNSDVFEIRNTLSTITAKKVQNNLWSLWTEPGTSASVMYTNAELLNKIQELVHSGWEIKIPYLHKN